MQRFSFGAHDGDAILGEPRNGRSHEMDDPCNLGLSKSSPGPETQHDRRARFLFSQGKHASLGQDEMDASRLDRTDGVYRSRELSFERAAVVDALLELGRAEVSLVEELEADPAAPRQAFAGKLETELTNPRLGHQDRRPCAFELRRHFELL